MRKYGYSHTESILNEWNPDITKRGTLEDSANVSEMFLAMQNTTVDMLMYYDGQVHGSYQGLFNPISYEPFKTYYVFKSFNELYKLKKQAEVSEIPDGISCVAATAENKYAIMLTNKSNKRYIKIFTDCEDVFQIYRINDSLNLEVKGEFTSNDEIEIAQFETVLLLNSRK